MKMVLICHASLTVNVKNMSLKSLLIKPHYIKNFHTNVIQSPFSRLTFLYGILNKTAFDINQMHKICH